MITREEIRAAWKEQDYDALNDLAIDLLKERDAAEARAEAYRKVALAMAFRASDISDYSKIVDKEAQRILQEEHK